MTEIDWSEYYEITRVKPPSKLLVKALEYVENKNKALDLGAGALKDTRYMLEQGFDVVAVDKSPMFEQEAQLVKNTKLKAINASFEDFDFPKNEYDIVSAMYSLPFTKPADFDAVFLKVKDSLVKGGIFCGLFFGKHDQWSADPKMTFHTKEQVEELLKGLGVISFLEEEKDDKTAKGKIKHWHIFEVIARK